MQPMPTGFSWWRSRTRPSAAAMAPRGDEI
jgi:hypothetical protein